MREYHRKSCKVSRGVYAQVKGILQDYDRLKRDRLDIIYGTKKQDGMPSGSDVGTPTEQKAIQLVYIDSRLEAIDQSAVLMRAWLGEKVSVTFEPIKAYWTMTTLTSNTGAQESTVAGRAQEPGTTTRIGSRKLQRKD